MCAHEHHGDRGACSSALLPRFVSPWTCCARNNDDLVENLRAHVGLHSVVVDALLSVDRAAYIADAMRSYAYGDTCLNVGGLTISAPHLHATFLQVLAPAILRQRHRHRARGGGLQALDVGCGSGYLTAALGHIIDDPGFCLGIDILPEIVDLARRNCLHGNPALVESGRVRFAVGDASALSFFGEYESTVFDVINVGVRVTEFDHLAAFIKRLAPGGRLVSDFRGALIFVDKEVGTGSAKITEVFRGVACSEMVVEASGKQREDEDT